MVNKVSEDVKDVLKKVKALAESKKAMKEELSRLQKDLENMTEEELQSLDSMELKKQIKFQESTTVIARQDVDFCVKVDDDIPVHTAIKIQSKEPTKKVMMIQESTMHEAVAVGMDTSDPMAFDYGQTHASTNGAAHVIKNEGLILTATHTSGNAIKFELDDSFLGGCVGINDGFHNRANHNFYKDLGVS